LADKIQRKQRSFQSNAAYVVVETLAQLGTSLAGLAKLGITIHSSPAIVSALADCGHPYAEAVASCLVRTAAVEDAT